MRAVRTSTVCLWLVLGYFRSFIRVLPHPTSPLIVVSKRPVPCPRNFSHLFRSLPLDASVIHTNLAYLTSCVQIFCLGHVNTGFSISVFSFCELQNKNLTHKPLRRICGQAAVRGSLFLTLANRTTELQRLVLVLFSLLNSFASESDLQISTTCTDPQFTLPVELLLRASLSLVVYRKY